MRVQDRISREPNRAALLALACLSFGPYGCATQGAGNKGSHSAPTAQAQHEAPSAAILPAPAVGTSKSEPPKLVPREALPRAAREALSARMERHSEELTFLLASVVLLDYPEVETLAE